MYEILTNLCPNRQNHKKLCHNICGSQSPTWLEIKGNNVEEDKEKRQKEKQGCEGQDQKRV